ncbi:tRNA (N(6)-L-threonylcarbamoyladenosine(37)-C(2))-methylthiotransferase MtaB [uncultured Olegusella sp.]|uniref:tRNA (N(6)-L-threonylcarbamoyladenosine(37)-C(2))- methylthiotransferase MtaB n=1 Tax=uncultured Olegusella sp. TaxID=1979846 RepID=UPI00261FD61C|nr:tRNA (N(6)-L-threonylcarbamoyladenosine(37)-C(2))-methylthiotransferase MtaB [uncultured Olegusella sp.]
MTVPKVAFHNLGCRLNRLELDLIADELEDAGCMIVSEDEADAIVVNTCAVTNEAEAKCRKVVRYLSRLESHPLVFVTGCDASLFGNELQALSSSVRVVTEKSIVAAKLLAELDSDSDFTSHTTCHHAGVTPTGRTRPGIKIQDGCDNRCTYCIIWKARGKANSLAPEYVLDSIHKAVSGGAPEVVLSGVNLGSYRMPGSKNASDLPALLQRILQETKVERIRLSSIEPPDVTEELVDVMAKSDGRIAPFLHICLQAGSDRTLRRMARVYDIQLYRKVVQCARAALPELALGCDLIVGFPGETDEDFEASLAFCEEMQFAKMHVFRYSKRPGTPAAMMPNQVPAQLMSVRARRIRELARRMRHQQAELCLGREELVVVQSQGRGISGGLFDVLLDPCIPVGSLVRVVPHSICEDFSLDARTI